MKNLIKKLWKLINPTFKRILIALIALFGSGIITLLIIYYFNNDKIILAIITIICTVIYYTLLGLYEYITKKQLTNK